MSHPCHYCPVKKLNIGLSCFFLQRQEKKSATAQSSGALKQDGCTKIIIKKKKRWQQVAIRPA